MFKKKPEVKFIIYALIFSASIFSCVRTTTSVSSSDKEIYRKVDSIMALMSLEEKAGQMLNIGFPALLQGPFYDDRDTLIFDSASVHKFIAEYKTGSIQNLGNYPLSPKEWRFYTGHLKRLTLDQEDPKIPLMYGIDAVHGANYTAGSVMFPHQIGLAATLNPEAAYEVGKITAYETKASGIVWNYAPVLDVARHPQWGRIYETFGEDTYVTKVMGSAMIRGMQGDDMAAYNKLVTCPKHYIGYGAIKSGKDRSPVIMPERLVREILLPPFTQAIEDGVISMMISSSSLNGIPMHMHKYYLTDVLKEELGFKGVLISDWNDIEQLVSIHRVAVDEREAVRLSVNAGLDVCMDPYDESFASLLVDLVNDGEVPLSRVDDAVRRILYMKFRAGLFEDPLTEKHTYDKFASEESHETNYNIACESITLLKNENDILPLSKNKKVFVTGVAANSINYLNGGWSRTWGGEDTRFNDLDKLTILEALNNKLGANNVTYEPGTSYLENINIDKAVRTAKRSDIIIACVGEKPATEKPSDIEDLELPDVQQELVKKLAQTGKPIVLVLVQGRPRIIRDIEPVSNGILMAYLPGNEGGRAITDILYGEHNPSGRLPYTYPRYSGSLWMYDHELAEERDAGFGLTAFNPQYEFGHGLSYTSFEYTNLHLSSDSISFSDTLRISIKIENTGTMQGKESVLMYINDEVANIVPRVKKLKGFKKIDLNPGQASTIEFALDVDQLKYVNQSNKWIIEPGYFNVMIGDKSARFYLYK